MLTLEKDFEKGPWRALSEFIEDPELWVLLRPMEGIVPVGRTNLPQGAPASGGSGRATHSINKGCRATRSAGRSPSKLDPERLCPSGYR
ncbi:protein of unknown function [Candidatus Methylocalor cossyra]|uniref:Uncharacterized protein n=1 Tax=Candidatus Methylocalor cossyra TaxID=3108543 RepID=A0ABP1CA84_9GAMM